MAEFKGKVALVAGNLGKIKKDKFKIGLSGVIAQKLIKNGCKVCIVDTDYKIAKACAEEINNENVKAYECDFFQECESETEKFVDKKGRNKTKVIWTDAPAHDLVKDIIKEFKKLDILITNFDEFEQARIDQTDDELFDYLRDQNTLPVFHLISAVRDVMSNQKKSDGTYGKIVFITNIVGKAGLSFATVYSAFKGAVVGLTKCLAKEFGTFANVNSVAIGPLSEKRMQGPKERIKKDYLLTQTPVCDKPLSFQDIAPLATFLASDDAVAINGQVMNVDGGLWLKLEV
ncbi:MAG: SDR family NAD(P)-dependent oxidoreductase [Promethearchaeota archaeon]